MIGPLACGGRISGRTIGASAAGNEQMRGGPAVGRTQSSRGFVGHPGAHAVAKKSERHRHQWLEGMMQPLHKRIHLRDRGLAKACGPAWQFHRTEIDCRRHKAPQWSIKCSVPRGVREDEKTAANDGAFIPKWIDLSSVIASIAHSRQPAHKRCRTTRSRASQVQAKPKSDSSNARRSLTCSCGSRRCTVQLFAGTDASD